MITSSFTEQNARLWDVNTGEAVACVPADGSHVALSRCASVFAVECSGNVQLYDWSGAALGSFDKGQFRVSCMRFTPCGKYVVVAFVSGRYDGSEEHTRMTHQYDVATMSCVHVIPNAYEAFVISTCSHVVLLESGESDDLVSQHLYPYLSDVSDENREE